LRPLRIYLIVEVWKGILDHIHGFITERARDNALRELLKEHGYKSYEAYREAEDENWDCTLAELVV